MTEPLDPDYVLEWQLEQQRRPAARADQCRYCAPWCAKGRAWHGTTCRSCSCPSSIKEFRP